MADVSVAVGVALLPLIWITADPGEPTLYDAGEGARDTTMYLFGAMTLSVSVFDGDAGRRRARRRASRSG